MLPALPTPTGAVVPARSPQGTPPLPSLRSRTKPSAPPLAAGAERSSGGSEGHPLIRLARSLAGPWLAAGARRQPPSPGANPDPGRGAPGPVLSCRLLVMGLVLLLTVVPLQGCSGSSQPPRTVLLDALSLQIRLTQEQVARALQLEPAGLPEVSRVRVEEQQPIPIGEGRGLRLTGRFDWRLADDPIRVDSPFELYLQRGEKGQSWRLARPVGSVDGRVQEWITEPLPLPAERRGRTSAAASDSGGAG